MTHETKFFRRLRLASWICLGTLLARAAFAQPPAAAEVPADAPRVNLVVGRSAVLTTDFDVTRIAITNPEVANAVVVAPREILVDGRASGAVSLIVWGDTRREEYLVVVNPGVTTLEQELQRLFPGEDIRVSISDQAVILSGRVSNNNVMLQAGEIAQKTSPDRQVINLLQLPSDPGSEQVMLQVRFAEVSRRALTELGVSFFTGPTGAGDIIGRSTTQQFPAPDFENLSRTEVAGDITELSGEITFSDFLNLFIFNTKENVGGILRALKSRGFLQSLAEPNLIAYDGQEASFLAGGEFPVPVVQGATGTVTIVFKEFGIRLNFTPTIAGDTIRLHVRPEVSSLDFTNGIVLQGFRVPALQTRRAETEVELRDGQSFAIAGLLDNVSQEDTSRIPILGDIPIIGALFRSKAERQERTELMVLITPRLVRPLNPDEVPPLPTNQERFMPPPGVGNGQGDMGLTDGPRLEEEERRKHAGDAAGEGGRR